MCGLTQRNPTKKKHLERLECSERSESPSPRRAKSPSQRSLKGSSPNDWCWKYSQSHFGSVAMILTFMLSLTYITKVTENDTKNKDMGNPRLSMNTMLCGRYLPLQKEEGSEEINDHTEDKEEQKKSKRRILSKEDDFIVLIGETNHGYGLMNNKLNAIFHAQDYVSDINAKLALGEEGWAIDALKTLFEPSILEEALNIAIVDVKDYPPSENTYVNRSRHMYWYHTDTVSAQELEQRRLKQTRQLWLHATRNNPEGKDMCSSIIQSNLDNEKKYTVVHVRDMNDGKPGKINECYPRLKNMNRRNGVHPDASCKMSASYIKSILRPINKMNQDIYIISNGPIVEYLAELRQDNEIGPYIKTVPKHASWAGSDMMFGILADVFIGSPISTYAGNIARARNALGFEPSSNFLFLNTELKPFCNSTCLYDSKILASYVG